MAACKSGIGRLQPAGHVAFNAPRVRDDAPEPRGGHTLTCISPNALLLFGGWVNDATLPNDGPCGIYFNYITLLELQARSAEFAWRDPPRAVVGTLPAPRANHTATLSHTGEHVVVFGGCCNRDAPAGERVPRRGDEGGADKMVLGDCHVLHMHHDGWTWQPLATEGEPPSPRMGHTATEWRGSIVFFGGRPNDGDFFGDTHVLESARRGNRPPRWMRIHPTGSPPAPRAHHTACLLAGGNRIAVYGGITVGAGAGAGETSVADAAEQLSDVWLLTLATPCWERVELRESPLRSSHAAVALPPTGAGGTTDRELLIVFGGRRGTGRLNVVSVLALAPEGPRGQWSDALTATCLLYTSPSPRD